MAQTAPRPVRVRGRSFIAFVLAPEPPIAGWLAELDAQIDRAPNFFDGRPIVLDASALPGGDPGLPDLIGQLVARGIRLIAAEGVDPAWPNAQAWPPMLNGGRPAGFVDIADEALPEQPPPPREATSLLIGEPVRSGQSVVFPGGDVTVLGSVASGAEVVAGGSIHVYGALRGRAVAGLLGQPARIFCRRFEAELLAIDGRYKTIDGSDALRGKAVQAWLDGDSMVVASLD